MQIIQAIMLFFEIIIIIIIIDVILSWLTLLWLRIRPKFIANIIDPMYFFVKKYIPTNIGPFDLTPIVIIFSIYIIQEIIIRIF